MSSVQNSTMRTLGAICPSSRWLGQAMVAIDDFTKENLKILEIGAGTGAVTKQIIKKLKASQELDIVEIMPPLAKILHKKFGNYKNIQIFNQDIRLFDNNKQYDIVISSLPFNAFSPVLLQEILDKIKLLSYKNTKMSFFEYQWSQIFVPLFADQKRKQEFFTVRKIIEDILIKQSYNKTPITLNIPPAWVYFISLY